MYCDGISNFLSQLTYSKYNLLAITVLQMCNGNLKGKMVLFETYRKFFFIFSLLLIKYFILPAFCRVFLSPLYALHKRPPHWRLIQGSKTT